MNEVPCSDCGFLTRAMTSATLRRGSSVREPGETLCPSCTSKRIKLVRELDALPSDLVKIKSMRMVVSAA